MVGRESKGHFLMENFSKDVIEDIERGNHELWLGKSKHVLANIEMPY